MSDVRHLRGSYNTSPLQATSGSETDIQTDGYGHLEVQLSTSNNGLGSALNPIITSLAGIAGIDGYSVGTLSAQNQFVSISTQGCQSVSIVLTTPGGFSGQVTFQQQPAPNAAWLDDYCISEAGIVAGAYGYQTTTAGVWIASVGGYYAYRVLCNIWSSGTMNVSMDAAVGVNTATDASMITDMASHGPAAVKNASTAAVATDPALVVALSPNNPLQGWTGSATVPLLASASGVLSCNIANDGYSTLPVGGIYNGSSNPGIGIGVLSPFTLDGYSNLETTLNTLIAGEDLTNNRMMTAGEYSFVNLTASGQVKASSAILHSVVINSAASSASITIANATSGTTPPVATIVAASVLAPVTLIYDVICGTGIYVTISGAAANVTITYV